MMGGGGKREGRVVIAIARLEGGSPSLRAYLTLDTHRNGQKRTEQNELLGKSTNPETTMPTRKFLDTHVSF